MKADGGQAFPTFELAKSSEGRLLTYHCYDGMSLRDYFAAAALQGMMAYSGNANGDFHTNSTHEKTAAICYEQADAMIAEREK